MSRVLSAADNIANIAPDKRCYEGASASGQLKFPRGGQGWAHFSLKVCTYIQLGAPATLAMGWTECCAELGRGKVSIFFRYSPCCYRVVHEDSFVSPQRL